MRQANTQCCVCKKAIYRRPCEISNGNVFCSRQCFNKNKGLLGVRQCCCGVLFKPEKKTSKYCSRSCANKGRKGLKYTKLAHGNKSRKRIEILKKAFNFKTCMIHGCVYERSFDVHRLIPGVAGGKYEIGNMFAICPNHHREIHNKVIVVEKTTDCELVIVKDNWAVPC